jgi:hypothetical protein
MKELSLHILDIAQNSLVAGATLIEVSVNANTETDILRIEITDNGKGIAPEVLPIVMDPYTTSRTTRKVGMGLPLLKDACEMSGGSLTITSEVGKGTAIKAMLGYGHIDRQPLGDISGVIMLLVSANINVDFIYKHSLNGNEYIFDTREIKEVLEGLPLNSPEVYKLLKEMLSLNLDEIQIR